MFQSYKYIKAPYRYKDDPEYKDDKWSFEYELIDSKFGTVSGVVVGVAGVEVGIAVIQEYSQRKLNVAANLVAAFVWEQKMYPNWSIQQMIDRNKKYNPLFPQYEEELQKYLLLL